MNGAAATGFPIVAKRSLKRRGIRGFPRAWIEGDALRLKGDTELAIPLADIEHARIGPFFGGNRTRYAATLRTVGVGEPLEIVTYRSSPEFAAAMRRLASTVLARRGIGAVEGGMPLRRSLVSLLLLSAFSAAVGYQIAVVFEFGSWARAGLPLLGLAVTVPAYVEAMRKTPRRIHALHELDQFLPRSVLPRAQQGGLPT